MVGAIPRDITLRYRNTMPSLTKIFTNEVPPKLKRKTPAQRQALDAYNRALREEDRYLGSVFANQHGQKLVEAKTQAAYAVCVSLGMTFEHGL